jgi:hypothetical protein
MKLPWIMVLAGLLLTISAAVYAQANQSSYNIRHRGWLGRPTSMGMGVMGQPKRDGLGIEDLRDTEQALEPDSSAVERPRQGVRIDGRPEAIGEGPPPTGREGRARLQAKCI